MTQFCIEEFKIEWLDHIQLSSLVKDSSCHLQLLNVLFIECVSCAAHCEIGSAGTDFSGAKSYRVPGKCLTFDS